MSPSERTPTGRSGRPPAGRPTSDRLLGGGRTADRAPTSGRGLSERGAATGRAADRSPAAGRAGADRGPAALDDKTVKRLEREHAGGLSAAQIVDEFTRHGVHLSEATFRKWVQLGLLPRSRRVGRKGKHQGSRGLYPATALRRINEIKRLMADDLTIDEIGQALQYRDDIDTLSRGLEALCLRFETALAAEHTVDERGALERLIADARRYGGELVERLEELERRIVTPLERAARRRAFGAGSSGGAGDLL